ncbi:MAG: hypothetical protein FJ137_05505 [Deltaproteobacteria bacterium]|nr:hypothetical protein [Deltaproteobacteria bacterium]
MRCRQGAFIERAERRRLHDVSPWRIEVGVDRSMKDGSHGPLSGQAPHTARKTMRPPSGEAERAARADASTSSTASTIDRRGCSPTTVDGRSGLVSSIRNTLRDDPRERLAVVARLVDWLETDEGPWFARVIDDEDRAARRTRRVQALTRALQTVPAGGLQPRPHR